MVFEKFTTQRTLIRMCLLSVLVFMFGVLLQADEEDKIETRIKNIQAEIQKRGCSFTVGRTNMSHLQLEKLCGLKEPKDWRKKGKFDGGLKTDSMSIGLPASWDWRDHGCVTPVKKQGLCPTCWAFGTIGAYEAAISCIHHGPLVDLSEQYLIDCNSHKPKKYGCLTGGWWDFDDMHKGVPFEDCYPYECFNRLCFDGPCKTGCPGHFPVYAWYYVGNPEGIPDTDSIKTAIWTHGPVVAGVCVDLPFWFYTGGIFDWCDGCDCMNHAIVIVGWNDNGGYWIIKNSFGVDWGEEGYMRIKYGCCKVGYGAAYAIPIMDRKIKKQLK